MFEDITASKMFYNAHKLMEAYHTVFRSLCAETGLSPMALDILMFLSNNPGFDTAKDICRLRGMKPGIVSFHVDRLVEDGLIKRLPDKDDRRKIRLACTEKSAPIVSKGHDLQRRFADRLLDGLDREDIEHFQKCLLAFGNNIDSIRENRL